MEQPMDDEIFGTMLASTETIDQTEKICLNRNLSRNDNDCWSTDSKSYGILGSSEVGLVLVERFGPSRATLGPESSSLE